MQMLMVKQGMTLTQFLWKCIQEGECALLLHLRRKIRLKVTEVIFFFFTGRVTQSAH